MNPNPAIHPKQKGKRILVVDDELPIIEPLKYNLEKEGLEVSTALDGREALMKCQSFSPVSTSTMYSGLVETRE